MLNFDEIMQDVDMHHGNTAFIETLQQKFVPKLAERLAKQGHVLDIHVEQLGNTINIILASGQFWVAEFAITNNPNECYWVPVYRQH